MHPELGRFLTRDPLGYVDGMNMYTYVINSPIRYLDYYGMNANPSEPVTLFEYNNPICKVTDMPTLIPKGSEKGVAFGCLLILANHFAQFKSDLNNLQMQKEMGYLKMMWEELKKEFENSTFSGVLYLDLGLKYRHKNSTMDPIGIAWVKVIYNRNPNARVESVFCNPTTKRRIYRYKKYKPINLIAEYEPNKLEIKPIVPKRKMTSNLGPNPEPKEIRDRCLLNSTKLPQIPNTVFETNFQGVNPPSIGDVFGYGSEGGTKYDAAEWQRTRYSIESRKKSNAINELEKKLRQTNSVPEQGKIRRKIRAIRDL